MRGNSIRCIRHWYYIVGSNLSLVCYGTPILLTSPHWYNTRLLSADMSSKPHVPIIITNQSSKGRCVTVTLHQLSAYIYFQNRIKYIWTLNKNRPSHMLVRTIILKQELWMSNGTRKGWVRLAISASSCGSLYLECHLIAYNFAGNTVDCVGAFRGKCSTERKICRRHYSHWCFGRLNSVHPRV